MRLLHVIPSIDPREGGPVQVVLQLGSLHQKAGHTVEVVTADRPESSFLQSAPFPVHAAGPARSGYAWCPAMAGWLANHGPHFDAVIVHGLWQYPASAVESSLSGRVPYFVYAHGMLDPWFNERFPFKHIKKSLYWHARLHRILDHANGLIFTTEEEMERSVRSFFPFHWKGMIAPLGVAEPPADQEVQIAALYSRFPELRGRRFLLFFGRIHPKKGCGMLLRAFCELATEYPDIDLVMAGPGDSAYVQTLRKIVATCSLQHRVFWTGMMDGPEKWGVLRCAEALILPSHQENFAIAVVEAMAVGTAVLISDRVQIAREVVRSGAGLVSADTVSGTEQLIRRWLTLKDAERAESRANAGTCYRTHFTAERAADTLLMEMSAALRNSESSTTSSLRFLCRQPALERPRSRNSQSRVA